jgi:hypothetical protein
MAVIQFAADSTTLVLNGTALTDFIEGDFLELNPVNPLTAQINASAGGVNIYNRVDGAVHDLIVRVQRASAADIYLNSASNQATPVVFNGSVKEDFVKDGTAGAESYVLENGSLTTRPANIKNNQDGNGVMEYTIRFRTATRNI